MSNFKEVFKSIVLWVIIGVVLFLIFGRNTPEKSAKNFAKSILDGDAEKCVSLLDDRLIKNSNYETEKLFTKALEDILEELKKANEREYGSKWDFKIKVVDCFDYSPTEGVGLPYNELKKAVIKITYECRGLLTLKPSYETEYMTIYLVEQDSKWYVAAFDFSEFVFPSLKID